MDISIIIVSYMTRDLISRCITSIYEKTTGLQYEIIVVDNASTDGSPDLIRKDFPEVRLIASSTNAGFGKGNNTGIAHATGRYCFLLNPDTCLINNALKAMYDFMESAGNSSTGMCGAALFDGDGVPAISFGRFPKEMTLLLYSLPFTGGFRKGEGVVNSNSREPFTVDFVSGADLFIRRALLEQMGAFDENFFAYYEETDLALRASQCGFTSTIIPSAKICHLEGKSFKHPLPRQKIMFESSLYYLHKHARNRALFYLYRLFNSWKYSLYRLFADRERGEIYANMVGCAKSYRT